MATSVPAPELSLIPTFIARLDQLKAILPGLRELPKPRLDELQELLERAEKLVKERAGPAIAIGSEFAPNSLSSPETRRAALRHASW
jgi:hypothetical protein